MMGSSHAQMAGLTWVVLCVGVHTQLHPLPPFGVALSTIAAVSAGVAPDIDHPGSGITRNLGLVGKMVSRVVRRLSGGHRLLTHTLGASAAACAVTFVASLWPFTVAAAERADGAPGARVLAWLAIGHQALMATLLALLVATAIDLLPGIGEGVEWCAALIVAAMASTIGEVVPWWMLPAAVAWGWHAHLLCDRVTFEPIPYSWPLTPRTVRVSWRLFRTNSAGERWVVRCSWPAAVLAAIWLQRFEVPAVASPLAALLRFR